jgi:hypothetical protein
MFTDEKVGKNKVFWMTKDKEKLKGEIIHGWDIAKSIDYSVIISTNSKGEVVGYWRFNKVSYPKQVKRIYNYITKKFPEADNILRYDKTGIGTAICDLLDDLDWDVSVTGVTYNNTVKQEMVSCLMVAMETGFVKSPMIHQLEHECSVFEMKVTKSGLFTYGAPSGEHDDTVNALMLSVSGSYELRDSGFDQLDDILNSMGKEDSDFVDEASTMFDDDLEHDEDEEDSEDDIPDNEDNDNNEGYDYDSEMY